MGTVLGAIIEDITRDFWCALHLGYIDELVLVELNYSVILSCCIVN